MIRSADSGLFGSAGGVLPLAALGIGVAAVQWPVVAGAASSNSQDAGTGSGSWIAASSMASQARNDSPVFASSVIQSVIPDLIRDPVSASNSANNSNSTPNTPNTAVPSQFEASNQALAQLQGLPIKSTEGIQ